MMQILSLTLLQMFTEPLEINSLGEMTVCVVLKAATSLPAGLEVAQLENCVTCQEFDANSSRDAF